jgi:hypothetical protein
VEHTFNLKCRCYIVCRCVYIYCLIISPNFLADSDFFIVVLFYYFHLFAVPAYYALILRSLTVLEGLALYADPNFKVLAASYPYFAKRLLTDPNPYLRDALIELLFKDGKFRSVICYHFKSIIV